MQFKHLFLTLTFLLNLILAGSAQEPTLLEHSGGVRTVEFSPADSQLVASAGESNIIKLWNLQNDTVRTLRGHTDIVNSIAFSPNGELLVSVSDDRTIKLWNVENQQNIATLGDGTRYGSVAFSPDGQRLATGGGRHVKLWNVHHRVAIGTLLHEQGVRSVAFSQDGQLLAAGDGSPDGPGTVKVYDIEKRQVLVSLNANPKSVKAVEFSSDDRYLASCGWNGYLKVWDTSNWTELWTLPGVGHHDFAFSPDAKVIVASSNRGSVNLYWVEDGSNVAALSGLQGWRHPVDFSLDGTFALGAEDGKIRIWRIDTSPVDGHQAGAVPILHIDTYFQQLSETNAANAENIPEPAPPPGIVRDFFDLDPFYEQWINVGGFPVLASAKVNPYALKEAAWLIEKMIGHRPDVIRTMVGNKARFSVIAQIEIITEIPEYRNDTPVPPDFLIFRERGWGGGHGDTASSSEENILNYRGDFTGGRYNVLIHEFAHAIHRFGFGFGSTFDAQLGMLYEAAMKKGLWNGTYATSDRREYWAEGTQAWFHPDGSGSFSRFGNTRQALKRYDPGLARLLTEVYGDGQWRYTLPETRNHLRHLLGFNRREMPTFNGWPELEKLYRELQNPNSTGEGKWVNLKLYAPNQLSHLRESEVQSGRATLIYVNHTDTDILAYYIASDGTESFKKRIRPGRVRWSRPSANQVVLVKNANGKKIAAFRTEDQTGRALIGATTHKRSQTTQVPPPKATENVSSDDSEPQVLIAQSQRPPMYWIDTRVGTLHRLVSAKVETLVPNVKNATSLAVDIAGGKLYWAEKTSDHTGRIRRATLDGRNVKLVKNLTSVPYSIVLDAADGKIYLTNTWGKIQRLNVNGSSFQPNLITGLDSPRGLALDVAGGKMYWTEMVQKLGRIRRANLDGSSVQNVATGLVPPLSLTVANGKIYWTEGTIENAGKLHRANLDGTNSELLETLPLAPTGIAVDTGRNSLYLTARSGEIHRRDLNGSGSQPVVTGLVAPSNIAIGIRMTLPVTNTKESSVNLTFSYDSSDSLVPINRLQEWDGWKQGVWEKTPNGIVSMKPHPDYIKTTNMDAWDHWIYSHAPSRIMYAISDRNYTRFESYFDLPNNLCGGSASVRITVLVNNNMEIYDSGVLGISNRNMKVSFTIPENTEMLILEVSDLGNKDCDHFVFGSPKLYYATQPSIQETAKQHITDVNKDQKVNKTDLLLVVTALGEKPPANPNFDVNADGAVNIADVLLVIEALDDPIAAAAPTLGGTVASLDPALLTAQIDILRAESDGSLKYEHAIAFFQALLVSIRPTETRLLANYPNPFNPETWIPYQLAVPVNVSISIYTADGKLVRTLDLGHRPVGIYESRSRAAYWDGRNALGEPVASGLYFYTLMAGEFTATRKMLIRK